MRAATALTLAELEKAHRLDGALPGISTGFQALDKRLGGWMPGDLVLIQARPSMGKTALLLAHCLAAARSGEQVGILSCEQPAAQISARLLAMTSGVPLQTIRSGQLSEHQWTSAYEATKANRELPIRIYDRAAPQIEEVASICRTWVRDGVRLIMLDYLQRVSAQAPSRREEVSRIARALKTIARDCDVPIVALAQSIRDVDNRSNQRPGLADIAESSDCEREADCVISLYRDAVANPEKGQIGTGELNIVKNRHGETGMIKIAFDGPTVRFTELQAGAGWPAGAAR